MQVARTEVRRQQGLCWTPRKTRLSDHVTGSQKTGSGAGWSRGPECAPCFLFDLMFYYWPPNSFSSPHTCSLADTPTGSLLPHNFALAVFLPGSLFSKRPLHQILISCQAVLKCRLLKEAQPAHSVFSCLPVSPATPPVRSLNHLYFACITTLPHPPP